MKLVIFDMDGTLLAEANAREPVRPIAGAADLLAVLPAQGWLPALATGAWERAAPLLSGHVAAAR